MHVDHSHIEVDRKREETHATPADRIDEAETRLGATGVHLVPPVLQLGELHKQAEVPERAVDL
jgi:hypothetical protein